MNTLFKDKNGEELFEGDIIKCYSKGESFLGKIIYYLPRTAFMVIRYYKDKWEEIPYCPLYTLSTCEKAKE